MRLQKKITRKAKATETTSEPAEQTAVAVAEKELATTSYKTESALIQARGRVKKFKEAQIKAQAEASATTGKPEHSLEPKLETRAQLMEEAKKRGIPYFRILSRDALTEIFMAATTKERQAELIEAAKTKWKAGWGSGTKRTTPTAPTVIQEIAEEQVAEPIKEPKLTKKQRKQALAEKYLSIGKAGK